MSQTNQTKLTRIIEEQQERVADHSIEELIRLTRAYDVQWEQAEQGVLDEDHTYGDGLEMGNVTAELAARDVDVSRAQPTDAEAEASGLLFVSNRTGDVLASPERPYTINEDTLSTHKRC